MWSVHQRLMTLSLTAQERKRVSPTNSRWLTAVALPVKCWRETGTDTHTLTHMDTRMQVHMYAHTHAHAHAHTGVQGGARGESKHLYTFAPPHHFGNSQFAPLVTFSVCNTDMYIHVSGSKSLHTLLPPSPPPSPPHLDQTHAFTYVGSGTHTHTRTQRQIY